MSSNSVESLLNIFSGVDFALNPRVLDLLPVYTSLGGQPEEALRALCGGLIGLPNICNLLSQWLELCERSDEPTDDRCTVQEQIMQQLIEERFDHRLADLVLEGAAQPIWLEYMMGQRKWRRLLYRLSESHPVCLLLNFAIQRISEAGHQSEIASLKTATTYFAVFTKVLPEAAVAAGGNKQMILWDCHTFLFAAVALLCTSSSSSSSSSVVPFIAERIVQDLLGQQQQQALSVWRLLQEPAAGAAVARSCVRAMVAAGATNPGDITRLVQQQQQQPTSKLLRKDPGFVELLLAELFVPVRARRLKQMKNLNENHLYLLALAVGGGSGSSTVVERAQQACLTMSTVLQQVEPSPALLREQVARLRGFCQQSACVAAGCLHWLRAVFADDLLVPLHLALLLEIGWRHALLRPVALDCLSSVIAGASSSVDKRRLAVRCAADFLRFGRKTGLRAVHTICNWRDNYDLDQSLVREFIQMTTEEVGVYGGNLDLELLTASIATSTQNGR